MHVCVHHTHAVPMEVRRGYWGPNPGPLQQQEILTIKVLPLPQLAPFYAV